MSFIGKANRIIKKNKGKIEFKQNQPSGLDEKLQESANRQ